MNPPPISHQAFPNSDKKEKGDIYQKVPLFTTSEGKGRHRALAVRQESEWEELRSLALAQKRSEVRYARWHYCEVTSHAALPCAHHTSRAVLVSFSTQRS